MGKMAEKFCNRCGYDLTGLDLEGRCPECGSYYDNASGKGIRSNEVIQSYSRGDWVIRLIKTLGLVFVALAMLLYGVLETWKTGGYGMLIFTGIISAIFFASAVISGLSLRRL